MSIAQLIRQEHLPEEFVATVDAVYRPMADKIAGWAGAGPFLFGINGGQGTGKSTMALFLSRLLQDEHGLRVAVISIDDLYLKRSERAALARRVHPLLATRGVPGTHDVALGVEVVKRLLDGGPGSSTRLPRFDKAVDDPLPVGEWPVHQGRADVVILEGWCVGATPQQEAELRDPVNALEREEDADGIWRRHVNAQLAGPYRELFGMIRHLVLLKAPGMACIRAWRGEQEGKLGAKLGASAEAGRRVMDDAALDRFVAHFHRLTEHQWRVMPTVADAVLQLGEDHRIKELRWKEGTA